MLDRSVNKNYNKITKIEDIKNVDAYIIYNDSDIDSIDYLDTNDNVIGYEKISTIPNKTAGSISPHDLYITNKNI